MRGIHPKVTSGICRGGARYLAHNARFVAHLVSHPIDTTYHDVLVPMSRVASALGRAVVLSIQDPECAAASSQELVRRLCAAADDDPEEAIACMTELLLPFGVARLAAIAKNKVKASAGAGVGARFFALLQKARPVVAAIKECDAVAKVVARGKNVSGQVKEVLTPLQSSVKGAAEEVSRGAFGRGMVLSKNAIKHAMIEHLPEKVQQKIPFLLQKYSRDIVEKIIAKKSYFNKSWTQEQIENATSIAFERATKVGVKNGKYSMQVFGENITVYLNERGILKTAYGVHKYSLSDFGY